MRRILMIVGGILVALILIALILPFVIDADQFRPRVEAEATKALGREVKLGKLSLSIFSGGVRADNLSIADDPAFSKGPFLTAKSLAIGVDILPLITSKKLNVRSFTINEPEVNLVHAENGKWNVSTLGGKSEKSSGGSSEFSVGKFSIDNGKVTVQRLGSNVKPSVYTDVNLQATNISKAAAFPCEVSATPPGGGSMKVKGEFGPMSQTDPTSSPLTAEVKINEFDLGQSGFMDPSSGVRGLVNLDANIKSNGKTANLTATGTGSDLVLVQGGAPAKTPVGLDLTADYNTKSQAGQLTKGLLKIGSSAANLGGTFDLAGVSPKLNMRMDASNAAVSDIKGILPALGIVLPSGADLQGGTASAQANIVGPIDALVTTGNADLQNTKLAGFDLGSKLSAISKLAGIQSSRETTIQLLASNLRVSPQGTQLNNIKLVIPGIGTLTGDGVIGSRNDLDFKMRAQLQNIQGSALGALEQATGIGQKNADIPFRIAGTTSDPKFIPDVGGAVGGILSQQGGKKQSPAGLMEGLGGLFGKKKKQ